MIVEFLNVGRSKRSWQAAIADDNLDAASDLLVREVERHGGIMSSEIDVTLDLETGEGAVFVGGFRKVGDVRLLADGPKG